MALLVDGAWCSVGDLQAYDGSAMTIANEEGIDLAAKMTLSEAWITDRVDAFLRWEAARLTAQNAVVDERLKRWHLCNVLALLYRDASFSQENDRFEKRWKAYEQDAQRKKSEYFLAGVAYVACPVRKPDAPTVNVIVGTQAAGAYTVATTRVDTAGRESALSPEAAVEAPAGNGLTVTANGLASSEGWNVYASNGTGTLYRQNSTPLAAGVTWTLPASGLTQGTAAGSGQTPDGTIRQRRILPRG